jgi:restriction system protein
MARKKANGNVPTRYELFVPIIKALQELGGSGSIEEINNKVYGIAEISDEILKIRHGEKGTLSEVDYRLA